MDIREQIAYPDPVEAKRLRRCGAIAIVSVAAAMCAGWLWIEPHISALSNAQPDDVALQLKELRLIFSVLSLAVAVPVFAFGIWTLVLGRRVLHAQQWPYPGAKLMRPVPVLRGRRATARATVLIVLGTFLALAGPAAGAWLYFGVGALLNHLDRASP